MNPRHDEPLPFRRMLGIAGVVYLGWWFAVEAILPGSFNPLPGRLAVVGYFFAALLVTTVVPALRPRAELFFYVGAVFLLVHYFYVFEGNVIDINWVVGAYMLVFALSVMVQSRQWLIGLSALSLLLGIILFARDPVLRKTIFLPGLATIIGLCLLILTSRLRLTERLADTTARVQTLFDATFEGIAVHDRGQIIDFNEAFADLFGYSRPELLGMNVSALNAPEVQEWLAKHLTAGPPSHYESVGLRRDGSRIAIEISSKPHVYEGRMLRLAAVRDISERKRAEDERLELSREQTARLAAQDAIRIREEFISVAAHELRTPITSLQLQLEALARSAPSANDTARETYVQRARRQLQRLSRLVEELLDVTRLEAGKFTLTRERVELNGLVHDVVESLGEALQRAGCALELVPAPKAEGNWDRVRIEQVFTNLLKNARCPKWLSWPNIGPTPPIWNINHSSVS